MSGVCTATRNVTVGGVTGDKPDLIHVAMLVCDLEAGHETLHKDEQDGIWWREAERD